MRVLTFARQKKLNLAFAFAPALNGVPSHYHRFEQMLFDSKVEDSLSRQIESSDMPRPRILSEGKSHALNSKQRVEWALRLGLSRYPFALSELKKLSDLSLVDEGLRAYLDFKVPDPFLEITKWHAVVAEIKSFLLESPGRRDALLQQDNASLWKFILGDAQELKDPKLLALEQINLAERSSGQARLHALLLGRYELGQRKSILYGLESYDKRAIEMLVRDFGPGPRLAAAIEKLKADEPEVNAQKIPLLRKLKSYWQEREKPRLAADALSRVQMLELEAGDTLNAEELLSIAELDFEAHQYRIASQLYRRSADAAQDNLWLHAKALAGLANATEQDAEGQRPPDRDRLEWAAEYYRQAVEVNFGSENCDALLESYGSLLLQLGYAPEAVKVFELLYREAKKPEYKARGLGFAADSVLFELSQARGSEQPAMYKRYLGYLGFLSNLAPKSSGLAEHYQKARLWQRKLFLEKDPSTSASLDEIKRAIRK